MKREIKFRGFDEQSKEMYYDFQWVDSGKEGNDSIIFKSDKQKLSSNPHPFKNPYFKQQYHIMQYTGLKDKNGKDIYEGDILKHSFKFYGEAINDSKEQEVIEGEEVGQIIFKDGCFTYVHKNEQGGGSEIAGMIDPSDEDLIGMEIYEFEIIGNIHEDKHLLNSK